MMSVETPTVYIPTLYGGERLAACLGSLRTQTLRPSIVVADNGPGEGSRQLIEERFPEVERVSFGGANLGFGRALNRTIAGSGDGPIVLLNDDAVARPDFIENLAGEARSAQMVAAVLVSEVDQQRIDSAGVLVDQTLMGFDYLTGESIGSLKGAVDPLGPTGGAALYDRATFNRVGGFDEEMFLYYEDVDLALRISEVGGRCRLARNAVAVHAYSESLGARSANKYAMTGWSRGYLLRRYRVMSKPSTAVGTLLRESAVCAGQILTDRTASGLKARWAGWVYGRHFPARLIPSGSVTRMSVLRALELRRRRHAA
jgi:GT2 family glycosyltransferase